MPEDDHLGAQRQRGLLGLASWASGDLETAHRAYADGMAGLQRAGTSPTPSGARSPWRISGSRKVVSGEAMRTYEQALQRLRPSKARPVLRGTADMYVG